MTGSSSRSCNRCSSRPAPRPSGGGRRRSGVARRGRGPRPPDRACAAAVAIQSAFRGYMARRNYRSLRGLIRLQGVVRGPSVRRQTAHAMRCMQMLVRVQSQVRASRVEAMERRNRHHHAAMLRDAARWRAASQVREQEQTPSHQRHQPNTAASGDIVVDVACAGRRHLGGQLAEPGRDGRADEAEGGGGDQAGARARLRLLPPGTMPCRAVPCVATATRRRRCRMDRRSSSTT